MTGANEQAPKILDGPIGLGATGMREEFDSLGTVEVPADRYWGAQTQRSLEHFNLGNDRISKEVYHAYGYVKTAAVLNTRAARMPGWKGDLIERVCDEVIRVRLDQEFPLYVWRAGSGTQSDMNMNEVISNRCIQLVGGTLGSQEPVHPNDHVNMGQSSNDTFPTAMHIAAYTMAKEKGGPYGGASMNSVRSFGADLAIGNLSTWWVYLVGPSAGAVIAVGVAYVLRGPAKVQEAGAAVGTPLDRSA